MVTGVTATLIFTVFFLFYITEINANFIQEMLDVVNNGGFDITIWSINLYCWYYGANNNGYFNLYNHATF